MEVGVLVIRHLQVPEDSRTEVTVNAAVGIDIGGTFIKIVAVSPEGAILYRSRLSIDNSSVHELTNNIRGEILEIDGRLGEVQCLGVSSPGIVGCDGKTISWMKGRMNVLEGLNWTQALHRRNPVLLINDANAALKGEAWVGAGVGCKDIVMLTLGTGVGGSIICNGRPLTGSTGRAGHLGHISLNVSGQKGITNTPGSLEDAIGECTLSRRSAGRFASTKELVEAHLAGDPFATTVWHKSVKFLAVGLVSVINSVDPERIILGGGIARAGNSLFVPLRRFMDLYEWRPNNRGVEIVPAQLDDEAGAIGSAKHAMENYDASRTVSD
jgi:glucokinase